MEHPSLYMIHMRILRFSARMEICIKIVSTY
jgi:hypothetical protein